MKTSIFAPSLVPFRAAENQALPTKRRRDFGGAAMPKGSRKNNQYICDGVLKIDPVDRFWSKVEKREECWIWIGDHWWNGDYGRFFNGKGVLAHRYSYELHKGPIPVGLEIDHLCKVPLCVNPDHLEAVTPAENKRRSDCWSAKNSRKTHCKHGHSLSGDNIRIAKGERICRACKRDHYRKSRMVDPSKYRRSWITGEICN